MDTPRLNKVGTLTFPGLTFAACRRRKYQPESERYPHCKGELTAQSIKDKREKGERRGFCPHCGQEISEYLAKSQLFFLAF
jgi:hypothetical protein